MKIGNPVTYLFKKTWLYSEGNQKKIITFGAMFTVAQLIELFFQPLIWAVIMNVIQREGITEGNIGRLFFLISLTLISDLLFWAFHGPARVLEQINSFLSRMNYRKSLLKGVMTLPMEWHVDHHSGDTIDKVEKGTGGLYSFSQVSFQIIYAVVSLIGSYAILVYFSPPSAYIVLAMLILSAWITIRFDRVLIGQYKALNKAENQISESTFDAISNITTVIILRVEKLVFKALVNKIEKPLTLYKKNVKISEIKWFLTNVCATVMTIVVMAVYFWQNMGTSQGVLIGNVYLLTKYLGEISQLFFKFTSMYSDMVKYKARIMNSEELTKDFKSENFTNHVLPSSWKKLEIKNLSFSYHSQEEGSLHLEDIHFFLSRGERIALVGESGSGKTTLLKVIRDLYHPRNLELRVDGKVISEGFGGISRAIALVPQNAEIFATTILENITLGAEHDLEFVRHFTDMAHFTDVVEDLPHKFESSIKEKGVNLSGGQQQRLALARGLLACNDKDVVLLDEPTSSLDTTTELRVYRNIFRDFQDKTIISSIHRLHLLPLFDTIYLFDHGHIVASGNLRKLLSTSAEFQQMWQNYKDQSEEIEFNPV
ncbi:MAG: ABC transporter ATP-binding protein [Patescibacteria group bacterium]